ncbi:APC family permease [Microbacterium sp. AZCO]|uniref:APC family permease n=1 Tax=Microbacterium sp. AZCO TaxID=3142976 RepID=UPI0031F3D124
MTALERAIARPQPVHDFADASPLEGLERRSVGFLDVLGQSVSAVAPSAAATTMILLVAGVATPGDTVVAVVVAALLSLVVARTINQFARRMVTSGSLFTYVAKGLGPAASIATAGAGILGYGFVSVFALLGGAHYLAILAERVWPGFTGPLSMPALLLCEGAVLAVVLVRGIRLSTRLALVVEVLSVVLIALLLVALIALIGPVDPALVVPSAGVSAPAIAAGAMLALTAFVGFESASTLGVEARAPLRNIPRAITGTVVVAGLLYVLAAYTQVAGFAALGLDLAESESPVNDLATAYGVDQWGALADIGIAASFLACAIASATALTRVLFAMGRDGIVPRRFGTVHARFRTPIAAVVVTVPLIVLIPVGIVVAGIGVWDAMEVVIVVAGVGYIVAYALVCIAAPFFLRRIGELTVGAGLLSALAAVALIGGLSVYLVVEATGGNPGVWVALALAVLLGALVAWRSRRGAPPLDGIGSYDEPVASEVLGGVARREAR